VIYAGLGEASDLLQEYKCGISVEPENPKQLEEIDEKTCKWPIGHPNENSFNLPIIS